MTVRDMIKQLVFYPMDSQVVDTYGSPIMYMHFHSRESNDVRLEPKSQIDVSEWLDDYFEQRIDDGSSDYEVYDELMDMGFTLEDFKNYKEDTYKWAARIAKEYEKK